MQGDEAKQLLGFPPTSPHPTPSQIKEAYKRKAWESHPDRFPIHDKICAESKFKLISEAYTCLKDGMQQNLYIQKHFQQDHTGKLNQNRVQAASDVQLAEWEMTPLRSTGYVDPGWEHGIAQDDRKKKVKCNYCEKIVSGGIYRLKQHLARISGEVTYCKKAPEEVYLKMRENLKGCRTIKKQRQSDDEELASLDLHSNDDDDEEEVPIGYKSRGKQVLGNNSVVVSLAPLRSLGYVDPGWEHGVAQDDRKKKVKCNYCEKIVSGGINRFKQHLARIPGEVASCKGAPEEVYLKIKENMKWHRTGRRSRRPETNEIAPSETNEIAPSETNEIAPFNMHSDNEDYDQQEDLVCARSKEKLVTGDNSLGKEKRKRIKGRSLSVIQKAPKRRATPSSKQVIVKTGTDRKPCKEVISAICKFFYHAGVPLDAASSPYFHKMLELVGQYGQGLRGPPTHLLSSQFLQDEIAIIKEHLVEYKNSWAITGCTIMADSWKDTQGRKLTNFLVSCPRGVYCVSSVDVTDIVEDAANLFRLLDKVVEEVGEENVVQVITENTDAFKVAGKMLEKKRRKLFWSPCATYCIDQMLEDFVKIKLVVECMNKAKKVTKFIYNRAWLLDLMKKDFTEGNELLSPTITRFATSFANLQSLLDHKIALKRMFQSNKWHSSWFAKLDEGKEVEEIVLNSTFWKKMHFVRKSVDPILQVLLKVNSDEGLSMPSLYNDMYRAKLAIKAIHGDDLRRYGPFWGVIDNHWNSLCHHPLYVAAYFLNPSYRYRPDFLLLPDVMRGLNECIVRLEPDSGRRISASLQVSDFISAKADFGTELAVSTRMELDPASWWQQHGINCLELQRIAIRILSQTCSSFGCEHNWSTYDQIHRKTCNRLAQRRLNDLVYVHYNLRLKERQLRRKKDDSVILESVLLQRLLDDWIVDTEKQDLQEDEEILYNEIGQAEGYENEDGNVEARKGPRELVRLADVAEPLEVHPVTDDDNDDDDLDILDDDLTD